MGGSVATIRVSADGDAHRLGVVTPSGTTLWAEGRSGDDEVVVLRVPGSHFYGGLGRPQNYAPLEFEVYLVDRRTEVGDGVEDLEVRHVVSFRPRKGWVNES